VDGTLPEVEDHELTQIRVVQPLHRKVVLLGSVDTVVVVRETAQQILMSMQLLDKPTQAVVVEVAMVLVKLVDLVLLSSIILQHNIILI
jgi:hypothetical protein